MDKRTGFYYSVHHEGYVAEEEADFPGRIKDDPYAYTEPFDPEDEGDLFTDMYNHGIFQIRIGNRPPLSIVLEDLNFLDPSFMEYDLSRLCLGDISYKKLLWNEKAFFIVKTDDLPMYLKTSIDGKKYYCIFASHSDAKDYLMKNDKTLTGYEAVAMRLDKKKDYCLLGCHTTVLLDHEELSA